jgi:hypothetical protein
LKDNESNLINFPQGYYGFYRKEDFTAQISLKIYSSKKPINNIRENFLEAGYQDEIELSKIVTHDSRLNHVMVLNDKENRYKRLDSFITLEEDPHIVLVVGLNISDLTDQNYCINNKDEFKKLLQTIRIIPEQQDQDTKQDYIEFIATTMYEVPPLHPGKASQYKKKFMDYWRRIS